MQSVVVCVSACIACQIVSVTCIDVVKAAAAAAAANNNHNNHSKNEKTSTAVIENHSLYASHDADPQTALREMVVGNPLHVGWWDDNKQHLYAV